MRRNPSCCNPSSAPSPIGPAPSTSTSVAAGGGNKGATVRKPCPEVPIVSSSSGARSSSISSGTGIRHCSGTASHWA